jgi:hypothetical protein
MCVGDGMQSCNGAQSVRCSADDSSTDPSVSILLTAPVFLDWPPSSSLADSAVVMAVLLILAVVVVVAEDSLLTPACHGRGPGSTRRGSAHPLVLSCLRTGAGS